MIDTVTLLLMHLFTYSDIAIHGHGPLRADRRFIRACVTVCVRACVCAWGGGGGAWGCVECVFQGLH